MLKLCWPLHGMMFPLSLFLGLTVFFEESDGKYFGLCGAHMASVVCFPFFLIIYVAI